MNDYQHDALLPSTSRLRYAGSSGRFERQNNHQSQMALNLNHALGQGQGQGIGYPRWSPQRSYYYDIAMANNNRTEGRYQIAAPQVYVEPQHDTTTALRATPGSMDLMTTTTINPAASFQPRTSSSFLLSQAKNAAARHEDDTAIKEQAATPGGKALLRWPPLVPFPKSPATIVWGQRVTAKNEARDLLGVDEDMDPVEQVHMYHPKGKHFDNNVWVAFDLCY